MKKMIFLLSAALLPLVFFSCSPVAYVEKEPGVDLGNYKRYAWVETKDKKKEDATNPADFASLSIHNAVNDALRKEGWVLVTNKPDVLISYDILVEKSKAQRDEPVYTRPFVRYFYNPWFGRWGTIYYPSRFLGYESYSVPYKEATVTISMMDAKTDKKIWQGWTTHEMTSSLMTQNEVKSSVKSIFKKFDDEA